ncbi:MAG TPA: hypothetical protein VJ723_09715 [Candidatus Angelobacter sp.]|nr:hypothetical protein [Candidatus Angelobacter sp.]
MEPRPKTIPVVAAFLFAATVIAAVVGISLLFPNPLLDRLWELNKPGAGLFRSIGWPAGVFLLALAAGTCASAFGLLRRRRWAWWFAVALFAIETCGNVVAFVMTGDAVRNVSGAVISAAFLCCLLGRRTRRYFFF